MELRISLIAKKMEKQMRLPDFRVVFPLLFIPVMIPGGNTMLFLEFMIRFGTPILSWFAIYLIKKKIQKKFNNNKKKKS